MAEILVATGTWLHDGHHPRRVEIFKDNTSWTPLPTPPNERPEAPPPRDAQGYSYFARVTISGGGGSTRTILYGSTDGAMTAAAKMVASPIRWAD